MLGGVRAGAVVVTVEAGYSGPQTNVVLVATVEGASGGYTRIVDAYVPMHVQIIYMQYWGLGGQMLVLGSIRITDRNNLPVGGATVIARWTLPSGYRLFRQAPTNDGGLAVFWVVAPPSPSPGVSLPVETPYPAFCRGVGRLPVLSKATGK